MAWQYSCFVCVQARLQRAPFWNSAYHGRRMALSVFDVLRNYLYSTEHKGQLCVHSPSWMSGPAFLFISHKSFSGSQLRLTQPMSPQNPARVSQRTMVGQSYKTRAGEMGKTGCAHTQTNLKDLRVICGPRLFLPSTLWLVGIPENPLGVFHWFHECFLRVCSALILDVAQEVGEISALRKDS